MQESGIFKEAVKLPVHERAAYLDRACGHNSEMRLEVESLLRSHEQSGEFLYRPAIADATTNHGNGPERPGMRVGPYKLLQFLGEGGMGTVFLAEQTKPVRRLVALKIIKPGMDSSQILARFEAERQALALMDHPNIARVLDAGAIAELKIDQSNTRVVETTIDQTAAYGGSGNPVSIGRPYFVMELVKGVQITEFCDKNKLSTQQRLELFIPVCQAIQHAHMKGIIHRDIKPSNVLVALYDGKPVPKVIDFGVAKAMSEPLTQRTLFTQIGQIVGTIEYMSPEQATLNQLDIDTRSDVYSLGVLLYELLTGMTPINREKLRTLAFDQMLRTIREEEPMRPSARLTSEAGALATAAAYRGTESGKLANLLRGELDWIVMKCLEKERERRFITAGSLAQDIERYLKDEPVTACPPSLTYRMRKTYRRNRVMITAGLGAAILLLGGVAATSWQAYRATHAEGDALTKQKIAEKAQGELEVQNGLLEKERDDLKTAREQLRNTHYAASMSLIHAAWESDNMSRVIELLDENRPKSSESEIRNFEWHFWDRLCHSERRRWVYDNSPCNGINCQISGDGQRLVCTKTSVNPSTPKIQTTSVCVMDVINEREIFKVSLGEFVTEPSGFATVALSFNQNGSRFACTVLPSPRGADPSQRRKSLFRVYDVGRDEPIFDSTLENNGRTVLSPDGRWLASVELSEVGGPPSTQDSQYKNIRIWDLSEPNEKPVLIPKEEKFNSVSFLSFSPDGSRLLGMLSTGEVGTPATRQNVTLQIWDRATGQKKIQHPFGEAELPVAVYSGNGKRIAISTNRNTNQVTLDAFFNPRELTLTLFDGADDEKLIEVSNFQVGRTAVGTSGGLRPAFSTDGRRLAISGPFMPTKIIDVATSKIIQTIKSTGIFETMAFNTDGSKLLTAGREKVTRLLPDASGQQWIESSYREWDLVSDEKPTETETKITPNTVIEISRLSENGQRKFTYLQGVTKSLELEPAKPANYNITVRDNTGNEIHVFKQHTAPIWAVFLSPDGRWVLSSSAIAGEIFFWEADTGNVRWQSKAKPNKGNELLAEMFRSIHHGGFSPDSRWFLRPDEDGHTLVSLPGLQERFKLGKTEQISFSSDSQSLAKISCTIPIPKFDDTVRNISSAVTLYHIESGKELFNNTVAGFITHAFYSPDSRYFILESLNQISFINAATGEVASTQNSLGNLWRYVFSHDSRRLLTISNGFGLAGPLTDTSATVFELNTGKVLFRLEAAGEQINCVAFSPDDRRIATVANAIGSRKGIMKIWDATSGRELLTQDIDQPANVSLSYESLSFSLDGHRLTLKLGSEIKERPLQESLKLVWDATPRLESSQR